MMQLLPEPVAIPEMQKPLYRLFQVYHFTQHVDWTGRQVCQSKVRQLDMDNL